MDKPIKSFQGHTVSLPSALFILSTQTRQQYNIQPSPVLPIPPQPPPPPTPVAPSLMFTMLGVANHSSGKFCSDLKILKVCIIGQKVSFLCFWVFNCNPVPMIFYLPNPVGSRGWEEGRPMGMCFCASTSLGGVWRFWVFLAQFCSYWFITVRTQQKHWSVADLFWRRVCNDLALFF